MRRGLILVSLMLALAGSNQVRADRDDILSRRNRLERIFTEQLALRATPAAQRLQQLQRSPNRNLLYLGASTIPSTASPELIKLGKQFASRLVSLAAEALEEDEELAYGLFCQALAFDPTNRANKVIGLSARQRDVKSSIAKTNHPKLPWKRGKYRRVYSEHFQIATNASAKAGEQLAERLEQLHQAWQQLFYSYWSRPGDLQVAWRRGRLLASKSLKHRVVLFQNREQYIAHLIPRQPRIEISLGFYDVDSHTSYFFADSDTGSATHLHEVTHQLFQEGKTATVRGSWESNFWVIEGIAMYMESLRQPTTGAVVEVGGFDAHRLQFARYRCLQEGFYLPLSELVTLGQSELQQDDRIRRIYSQSAGLAHFLMDGQNAKYRQGLLRYLKRIYEGRDRADSLAKLLPVPLPQLDEEYKEFLLVTDKELMATSVRPDSMIALCLGNTAVTDQALRAIPRQANLEWLDVSRTDASSDGIAFALAGRKLRQLNLDGTKVDNTILHQLAKQQNLEELDLSNTAIDDEAIAALRGLSKLQLLWIDGTSVSDRSVPTLSSLSQLAELSIQQTKISAEGRARLRKALPGLTIH